MNKMAMYIILVKQYFLVVDVMFIKFYMFVPRRIPSTTRVVHVMFIVVNSNFHFPSGVLQHTRDIGLKFYFFAAMTMMSSAFICPMHSTRVARQNTGGKCSSCIFNSKL